MKRTVSNSLGNYRSSYSIMTFSAVGCGPQHHMCGSCTRVRTRHALPLRSPSYVAEQAPRFFETVRRLRWTHISRPISHTILVLREMEPSLRPITGRCHYGKSISHPDKTQSMSTGITSGRRLGKIPAQLVALLDGTALQLVT